MNTTAKKYLTAVLSLLLGIAIGAVAATNRANHQLAAVEAAHQQSIAAVQEERDECKEAAEITAEVWDREYEALVRDNEYYKDLLEQRR